MTHYRIGKVLDALMAKVIMGRKDIPLWGTSKCWPRDNDGYDGFTKILSKHRLPPYSTDLRAVRRLVKRLHELGWQTEGVLRDERYCFRLFKAYFSERYQIELFDEFFGDSFGGRSSEPYVICSTVAKAWMDGAFDEGLDPLAYLERELREKHPKKAIMLERRAKGIVPVDIKVEQLSKEKAIALACDCAERILPIFEETSQEKAPRKFIEQARRYILDSSSLLDFDLAYDAAVEAAESVEYLLQEHRDPGGWDAAMACTSIMEASIGKGPSSTMDFALRALEKSVRRKNWREAMEMGEKRAEAEDEGACWDVTESWAIANAQETIQSLVSKAIEQEKSWQIKRLHDYLAMG